MGHLTGEAHIKMLQLLDNNQQDLNVQEFGNDYRDMISHVFGLLVVKDVWNKTFQRYLIPSVGVADHAEDSMYEFLMQHYGGSGLPFHAKIIFVCTQSPCRQCTAKLLADPSNINGFWPIYKALIKSNALCYFSFVFKQYYTRGRYHAWGSPEEARQAYDQVEHVTDGFVTIRHLHETKYFRNRRRIELIPGLGPNGPVFRPFYSR